MPTGYTAGVQSGEITEFREFAMNCARAFGALILLRDTPEAEIPDSFKPSTEYHDNALEAARDRLSELQRLSAGECDKRAHEQYLDAVASFKKRASERETQRMRYKRMLAKVIAWEAPSGDHEKFKAFMKDQLTESIDFDCSAKWDIHPEAQTGEEWKKDGIAKAERDLEYHTEERAKEIDRTESRNLWLQQLRDSLATASEEQS